MNKKLPHPLYFSISLLLILFLAACGGQESDDSSATTTDLSSQTQRIPVEGGGSYTDVSAEGLALKLEEEDFPLINVHIPYEGEIQGTDEFIPFDQIEQNLDKLPENKDARLAVYCRSGSMSAISALTLVNLGYTDVWNLDGGMIAWEASGRPLIEQ